MAQDVGKDKVGRIECIVCGEYYFYNTSGHQSTHGIGQPQTYDQYKKFVGEKFGLKESHPLLDDDTVINPNKWYDAKDEYPGVEIGLRLG